MAKNKNRKQGGQQNRALRPEQAQAPEEAERIPGEAAESPLAQPRGNPADVARKQQRRFGHN